MLAVYSFLKDLLFQFCWFFGMLPECILCIFVNKKIDGNILVCARADNEIVTYRLLWFLKMISRDCEGLKKYLGKVDVVLYDNENLYRYVVTEEKYTLNKIPLKQKGETKNSKFMFNCISFAKVDSDPLLDILEN